jgi:hypothetical protein
MSCQARADDQNEYCDSEKPADGRAGTEGADASGEFLRIQHADECCDVAGAKDQGACALGR